MLCDIISRRARYDSPCHWRQLATSEIERIMVFESDAFAVVEVAVPAAEIVDRIAE